MGVLNRQLNQQEIHNLLFRAHFSVGETGEDLRSKMGALKVLLFLIPLLQVAYGKAVMKERKCEDKAAAIQEKKEICCRCEENVVQCLEPSDSWCSESMEEMGIAACDSCDWGLSGNATMTIYGGKGKKKNKCKGKCKKDKKGKKDKKDKKDKKKKK